MTAFNDAIDLYNLLGEIKSAIPDDWGARMPSDEGFVVDSLNDLHCKIGMFIIHHVRSSDLAAFETKVQVLRDQCEGFEIADVDWSSLLADVAHLTQGATA